MLTFSSLLSSVTPWPNKFEWNVIYNENDPPNFKADAPRVQSNLEMPRTESLQVQKFSSQNFQGFQWGSSEGLLEKIADQNSDIDLK